MTRISFFVPGTPRPQGSKRHVGRGVMVESSKYVEDWRHDVKQAAWTYRLQMEPLAVPLSVRLDFNLPRPKYHYGTNGAVKARYELSRPSSKPDIDKLARAVLDAITSSGLWRDDSLVVDLRASKWFTVNDPGVEVLIVPALGDAG